MNLNLSISNLIGVGPKMAEKMERLGIENIRDLLFYYPRRYDDFTQPQTIKGLRINDETIIKATISDIKEIRTKRRWMSLINATLTDESGEITAVWFNQSYLIKIFKPGDEFLFQGKVNWDFKNKKKNLTVTQFVKNPEILPVYGETEGLTSKFLRKLIAPILTTPTSEVGVRLVREYLPDEILKSENLIDLDEAIKNIHFPKNNKILLKAKRRLAFDELFLIAIKMLQSKKEIGAVPGIKIDFEEKNLKEFSKSLPYKLTNAQRKTAWQIIQDLGRSTPMNRLLEGDVGSGKTVVAAMAVLVTAKAGYQTVWLAPTEILANQHFQNVTKILEKFKVKVGLWTAANKKADLDKDDLIIGTHALLQKNIQIQNLALIIVDEQHRFGVKQRALLKKGTKVPHFLSMTATPIPRTLALAFYGDLDLSIIDEMPLNRQKIITKVISPEKRNEAYKFIESQVMSGRQAFVICPLIEEGVVADRLFDIDRKSVIKEHEKLSKTIFPKFKVGLLHGKMKSKDKAETMTKFQNGKIDILVATAVVEVGIDIVNATVMMIESAERFGLAQLHQFRGRVGRGEHQSYCFLFSEAWSESTKKRLNAMTTCSSGFELAQIDLDLRGPGEFMGIRQSGLPDLKMASLSDRIMIEEARRAAEKVVNGGLEKYPSLQEKYLEFSITKHLE